MNLFVTIDSTGFPEYISYTYLLRKKREGKILGIGFFFRSNLNIGINHEIELINEMKDCNKIHSFWGKWWNTWNNNVYVDEVLFDLHTRVLGFHVECLHKKMIMNTIFNTWLTWLHFYSNAWWLTDCLLTWIEIGS